MLHMLVVGQVEQRHGHVHTNGVYTVHIESHSCFNFIEGESKDIFKTDSCRSSRLELVRETAIHLIPIVLK